MRSVPCSQPVVVVPRKMTNVLMARASTAAGAANRNAMTPTRAAALTPLATLTSLANRVTDCRSGSDRARASPWARTQGTHTVATVEAHRISPWPAANLEYAATSSSRVSNSA